MYTLENTTINWFSKEYLYNVTNNIPSAVYAFVMAKKIPENTTIPFTVPDLFYVGMSGGLDTEFIGDKKNKKSHKVKLTTPVHQRMKHHMSMLSGASKIIGKPEEKKYQLFYDKYMNSDMNLYICLMVPQPHVDKQIMRNMLSMIESEQIILYHRLHKQRPLMNLSESSKCGDNRKNLNSYSQKEISRIKKQNIFELCEV